MRFKFLARRGPVFFGFLAAILLAGSLSAADWPMYLYDPAHNSFNAAEKQLGSANIDRLEPSWAVSAGAPIASAVTIADGILYFGAWDGNFYALNASDGSLIWSRFLGKAPTPEDAACMAGIGVTSQAALVGDRVYVGGGDAALYALNKFTGEVVSRTSLGNPNEGAYIWSSITVSKGALYLGVASLGDCPLVRGSLVRVDPANPGNPLIRYLAPADELGAGVWSTPAIDESTNTIYVTTGTGEQDSDRGLWGGTLLAIDATTLEIKRHYFLPSNSVEEDIEWGSSAALFRTRDGRTLVGATGKDGVLYARNAGDLSIAWTAKLAVQCIDPQQGCGSLSTPAFDGKTVFAGAGDSNVDDFPLGSVYALDPGTGAVIWMRETDGVVIAPLTVANGLVYASTTLGLLIFDAVTGDQLWDDDSRGALFSQPVVVDGTVYSTYVTGEVVAWRVP